MTVRTTGELATIIAIRRDAAEQNARNGHELPIIQLAPSVCRNWQIHIHCALRELGFSKVSRLERLTFLSEIFGRHLSSTNDLCWPEVQAFCGAVNIELMAKDLRSIANDYVLLRL